MVLVYVVLSTFLANASSDAMLHRIFTILLILSGGGEQGEHICVCVCVCAQRLYLYPVCLSSLEFLDRHY